MQKNESFPLTEQDNYGITFHPLGEKAPKPSLFSSIEFIKPIGVPLTNYYKRINELLNEEIPKRKIASYKRVKRVHQNDTLNDRINRMHNAIYFTFELRNGYELDENKTVKAIRRDFERKGIERWFLVSDYGENERLHFHGCLDLSYEDAFELFKLKYHGHDSRRHLSYYKNYDYFTGAVIVTKGMTDDYDKAVKYMTDYITKVCPNEELAHRIHGSRKGNEISMHEIAFEFFGDKVKFVD